MSDEMIEVSIKIQARTLDFYTPYAIAAGITLPELLARVLHEKHATELRVTAPKGLNAADRGVLLALLLLPEDLMSGSTAPGLSRRELQSRTGLASLTVVKVTDALSESGNLVASQAQAQRGRHGPAPMLYTLTPKGCATAFFSTTPNPDTSCALDRWERFHGAIPLTQAPTQVNRYRATAQAEFEKLKSGSNSDT